MTTEGISARRVARQDHEGQDVERTSAPPAYVTTDREIAGLFDRLERAYDVSGVLAATLIGTPPPNHGILYIGLNIESFAREEQALAKTGNVRSMTGGSKIGGVTYDFNTAKGIEDFVDSLKLDPRRGPEVAAAIRAADPPARGTVAHLAAVFAEAEHGRPIPSRLVISAHSGGEKMFGGAGELSVDDVQRLGRAMPRAAACIEDIHLSACSTSGQAGLDSDRAVWRLAFPNLKTMWAYAGTSRLAPTRDLEAWARATSKPHDTIDVPADLRNHHIATWSAAGGYRDDVQLGALRKQQTVADQRFDEFVSGDLSAHGQSADALRDYEAYRVLSQRNDVSPAERATLAQKANQLLRIRYYDEGVRSAFAARHGETVQKGFAALGMAVPNFATMTRKEAMDAITAVETKLASMHAIPADASRMLPALRGLRDLDSKLIPESDCHH